MNNESGTFVLKDAELYNTKTEVKVLDTESIVAQMEDPLIETIELFTSIVPFHPKFKTSMYIMLLGREKIQIKYCKSLNQYTIYKKQEYQPKEDVAPEMVIQFVDKSQEDEIYTFFQSTNRVSSKRCYVDKFNDLYAYEFLEMLEVNNWTHPDIEHWRECSQMLLK